MSREERNSPRFVQPLNTFLCSFHHQFVLCLELPFQKLLKHGKSHINHKLVQHQSFQHFLPLNKFPHIETPLTTEPVIWHLPQLSFQVLPRPRFGAIRTYQPKTVQSIQLPDASLVQTRGKLHMIKVIALFLSQKKNSHKVYRSNSNQIIETNMMLKSCETIIFWPYLCIGHQLHNQVLVDTPQSSPLVGFFCHSQPTDCCGQSDITVSLPKNDVGNAQDQSWIDDIA